MSVPRFIMGTFSAGLVVAGISVAFGQNFPDKPIRIVTAEAGGGSDFTSRLIGPGLSAGLGQPVIVDNRPSGVIPGDIVAKAPPTGHTLLVYNNILWIGPLIQKAPYDGVKDFSPVALVGRTPSVLVVHPSMAAGSVKELIVLAKAKPGTLNYASTGTGASNHLTAELFKSMAGIDVVRVNYKGGGPALNALIGGEVQLMFTTAVTSAPHVKSGKLKILAVTSAEPTALAPGVTTMAGSGLPGFESTTIASIFAPARTPRSIIDKLNEEIVRTISKPDIKERFFNTGMEIVGGSPDQLAAAIKSDMSKLSKVIKDAGIRAD